MASLTSSLIVSLIDKVSGPARGAAGALKAVDAASKSLGSGTNAKGFQSLANSLEDITKAKKKLNAVPFKGLNIADEFKDLRLTSRELKLVTKDYEALRTAMRGMKASDALGALTHWKTQTIADLRQMRSEMAATERARERMVRGWRSGARFAAGAAGLGGAAYATQRGIRGTVRATGEYEREGGRAYLAGMTPAETVKAQALSRQATKKYPSIDAAQIMERLRSLRSFTGDFDKGARLLDDQLQGLTVLQSVKGKDRAMDQMQQFMRGMDVLGKNEDPAVVGQLTNAYIKALGVDPDLDMGQFSQFARKSKAAGAALSNDFLGSIVPTFMQDLGGPELGTALGTEVSQTIAGRGTAKSKAYMSRAGLRDKKGRMVDPDLLLSNPYDWINKHAPGAMRKMKLDPTKDADVTKFMSEAFSAQTVSNLFGKFLTQRDQAERNKKLYANAPDMKESAAKLRDVDPFVSAEGFMAQLRNFGSALAEGPLKSAIPMLNSFTDAIARLTDTLSNNPDMANKAGWAATAAGATGAGAAAWLTGRRAIRWLAGGGNSATTPQAISEAAAQQSGPKTGGFLRGAGNMLRGAGGALAPAVQMATQPDIIDMSKPRDWWSDQYVQPFWKRLRERRQQSQSYGKDFTLGSDGSFTRSPSYVPPSGFKSFSQFSAARVGGGGSLSMQAQPWTLGTSPLKSLDMSSEAGAAGNKSGAAFTNNLDAQLQAAISKVQSAVQQMQSMLNFSASPTITPKIGPLPSGQRAALDSVSWRHATFSDATNFGVV